MASKLVSPFPDSKRICPIVNCFTVVVSNYVRRKMKIENLNWKRLTWYWPSERYRETMKNHENIEELCDLCHFLRLGSQGDCFFLREHASFAFFYCRRRTGAFNARWIEISSFLIRIANTMAACKCWFMNRRNTVHSHATNSLYNMHNIYNKTSIH